MLRTVLAKSTRLAPLLPPAARRAMSSYSDAAAATPDIGFDKPVKRSRHPAWYPPAALEPYYAAEAAGGGGGAARAEVPLMVLNSLTETLEPFEPLSHAMLPPAAADGVPAALARKKVVRWYTCGPTVYDHSHMGHARAYLTFDIIRRILENYFNYAVVYQMNITDIDDKIIKRARVNKLLADYRAEVAAAPDGRAALAAFAAEALAAAQADMAAKGAKLEAPLPAGAGSRLANEREEKRKEHALKAAQLEATAGRVAALLSAAGGPDPDALFAEAGGLLGERLDELRGAAVSDQGIFDAHARKYERLFFEDLRRLGVKEPDVITRVTEYVPQVVEFIQQLIDRGFAYEGQSSIFFDTEAFKRAGHDYPKLKTGAAEAAAAAAAEETTEEEMKEGEGALSAAAAGEKRHNNDFALWKFSKPGEPQYPSPWGRPGRPGWHIECSVMAADVFNNVYSASRAGSAPPPAPNNDYFLDIHAGGWDLKFPHHDNECAQSEAFLHAIRLANGGDGAAAASKQWVNYFLHCGHLHIKGLKMSKSLKNFITIQEALDEKTTPRRMRLLFLSNSWHRPMNFSDDSLSAAAETERVLRAFFGSVDIVLRGDHLARAQGLLPTQPIVPSAAAAAASGSVYNDRELLIRWQQAEEAVHLHLCNNFDTPAAMAALMELVSFTNQYMAHNDGSAPDRPRPSATLVAKAARFVTRILQVFGVIEGSDGIGFEAAGGAAGAGGGAGAAGGDGALTAERQLQLAMDALVRFRDGVRDGVRGRKDDGARELLALCDALRDEWLVPAGVRLEDKPGGGATQWKRDDPRAMREEQQQRRRQAREATLRKLNDRLAKLSKKVGDAQRQATPPEQLLASDAAAAALYAGFDPETGLPTALADGSPVPEKTMRKLTAEIAKHRKGHAQYLEKGGEAKLAADAAELEEVRRLIAEEERRQQQSDEDEGSA